MVEPLRELVDLLDDRLLERRFASYAPERDPSIFPDEPQGGSPTAWLAAKRDLLTLTALRSPSALHWLFAKVYPELRVTVRRAPQDRWIDTPDVRLGTAELGKAALGGLARLPIRGVEVTLLCPHRLSPLLARTPDGGEAPRPWAEVAEERLESLVFPVLRATGLQLAVMLLLLDGEAEIRLDGGIPRRGPELRRRRPAAPRTERSARPGAPDHPVLGPDPGRGRRRRRALRPAQKWWFFGLPRAAT